MFRVGQKVVCINGSGWDQTKGRFWGLWKRKVKVLGPSKGEVCLILDIKPDGYLGIKGYERIGYYQPEGFKPLDYDFVEKVIKNVKPEKVEI